VLARFLYGLDNGTQKFKAFRLTVNCGAGVLKKSLNTSATYIG
jgi:hypothetical protein